MIVSNPDAILTNPDGILSNLDGILTLPLAGLTETLVHMHLLPVPKYVYIYPVYQLPLCGDSRKVNRTVRKILSRISQTTPYFCPERPDYMSRKSRCNPVESLSCKRNR